jgi:hypothetical protein
LAVGGAYYFTAYGGVQALPDGVRQQVTALYPGTFNTTWLAALVFSVLRFLLVFAQKPVEMRKKLDTEISIEKKKTENTESAQNKYAPRAIRASCRRTCYISFHVLLAISLYQENVAVKYTCRCD